MMTKKREKEKNPNRRAASFSRGLPQETHLLAVVVGFVGIAVLAVVVVIAAGATLAVAGAFAQAVAFADSAECSVGVVAIEVSARVLFGVVVAVVVATVVVVVAAVAFDLVDDLHAACVAAATAGKFAVAKEVTVVESFPGRVAVVLVVVVAVSLPRPKSHMECMLAAVVGGGATEVSHIHMQVVDSVIHSIVVEVAFVMEEKLHFATSAERCEVKLAEGEARPQGDMANLLSMRETCSETGGLCKALLALVVVALAAAVAAAVVAVVAIAVAVAAVVAVAVVVVALAAAVAVAVVAVAAIAVAVAVAVVVAVVVVALALAAAVAVVAGSRVVRP